MPLARLAALLGIAAAAYGTMLAAMYWRQESFLFHPEPLPPDYRFEQPDVREVAIAVPGATLSALHLKHPGARALVFFLHGNGGNLASWFTNADFYRDANVDLFMIDYRGYGKSTGRIESEAQLLADVRAAWDRVAPEYAGRPKVVYGRSLGTGLAALLAAEVQPELTVLVSPYCSMEELARLHYPYIPVALLRYPLATCDAAPRIGGRLLLIHGEGDTLIPVEQSERILVRAPRAELLRLPEGDHDNLHLLPGYQAALRALLKGL